MFYDQGSFDIRCEWGMEGLQELLPVSRAVVIGDVLSFTTCVDIAAGNGAMVFPFRSRDHSAAAYARSRNALLALAGVLRQYESGISIIPAGERWKQQQTLRPAIEDLIGAGAVIHGLEGTRSPEAETAARVFEAFRDDLESVLCASGSGKELIGRGFSEDVRLAAALDASRCVPLLKDGAFRAYQAPGGAELDC